MTVEPLSTGPLSTGEVAAVVAALVLASEPVDLPPPDRDDELAWRTSARQWRARARHDYRRR